MKQFFKIFFASSLGFIFGSFLVVLIGIGIIASLASGLEDDEKVKIEAATILHFKP